MGHLQTGTKPIHMTESMLVQLTNNYTSCDSLTAWSILHNKNIWPMVSDVVVMSDVATLCMASEPLRSGTM